MQIDELLQDLSDDEPDLPVAASAEKSCSDAHESTDPAAIAVEIDARLIPLGNRIRACYSPRFPELESLVPDLEEFCNTIDILGTDLTVSDPARLDEAIGKARSIVVQMCSSETPGREMTTAEQEELRALVDTVRPLFEQRRRAVDTLASMLTAKAPNLLEVVELNTAVNLVAYTGGLAGLARTPSCNVPSLGARRLATGTHTSGLADHVGGHAGDHAGAHAGEHAVNHAGDHSGNRTGDRHGILHDDPIIKSVDPVYKRQALRLVSGKLVLAARMDLAKSSRDGSQGRAFRAYILARLEKMTMAPQTAQERALPVPEDKKAKPRGGRRSRRLKQQLSLTERQRQRNRLAFGKGSGSGANYGLD